MIMCAFVISTSVYATKTQIPLNVVIEDDSPLGNGNSKSPMKTPTVYIDDHMLFFEINHSDYVVNIKDEDGDVVYTTVVYSTQTQVLLPFTTGVYEIEIVVGNLLFTGVITL